MAEFFTFEGRVRRITLWVNGVVSFAILMVLVVIASGIDSTAGNLLVLIVYVVLAIRGLSVSVRRWHDLNKSGVWVLVNAVPFVGGLYSLIVQGFMPGDPGPNQYGDAPEEGQLF